MQIESSLQSFLSTNETSENSCEIKQEQRSTAPKYIFLEKNEIEKCKCEVKPSRGESSTERKIIKLKAHEAEDTIVKQRPPLRRQLSESYLDVTCLEKPEAKNGEMWECLGWKHDTYGGKIYTFKEKPEYNIRNGKASYLEYFTKQNKIFPAVERDSKVSPALREDLNALNACHAAQVRQHLLNKDLDDGTKEGLIEICMHMWTDDLHRYQAREELKKLGYEYQCVDAENLLRLPDRTALMARWALLRNTCPELPKLDIISSEGIAGDMEFVEAFINHDCLLSSGKEFVHDHTAHLIPTLALMLLRTKDGIAFDYSQLKFDLANSVMQNYQKLIIAKNCLSNGIPELDAKVHAQALKNFPQIETVLGAFVDSISSDINADNLIMRQGLKLVKITAETINEVISACTTSGIGWNDYMKRRFGDENVLTKQQMQELWQLINKIVDDKNSS